jgi:hypothetical protein
MIAGWASGQRVTIRDNMMIGEKGVSSIEDDEKLICGDIYNQQELPQIQHKPNSCQDHGHVLLLGSYNPC